MDCWRGRCIHRLCRALFRAQAFKLGEFQDSFELANKALEAGMGIRAQLPLLGVSRAY